MWAIHRIKNNTSPLTKIAFTDGQPLDATRGTKETSYYLIIDAFGFLTFTDMGRQPDGECYRQLLINEEVYCYNYKAEVELMINNDGSFNVQGDGNMISGMVIPLPVLSHKC